MSDSLLLFGDAPEIRRSELTTRLPSAATCCPTASATACPPSNAPPPPSPADPDESASTHGRCREHPDTDMPQPANWRPAPPRDAASASTRATTVVAAARHAPRRDAGARTLGCRGLTSPAPNRERPSTPLA